MFNAQDATRIYANFNLMGVLTAYGMLGLSIFLTDIPLSAKGFWAMGVFLLTLSLVNFVKYRTDDRQLRDRVSQLEAAKTEKMLKDYVSDAA